jgi:plastocyanin
MESQIDFAMLRPTRRSLASLAGTLALVLTACGTSPTPTPDAGPVGECAVPVNGIVHISADDLEFSHDCIRVPADEPFAIELTNNESQVHNVEIFSDESKTEELARGELITGPNATTTLQAPALTAGDYYFDCLVHPAMNGTLIAE